MASTLQPQWDESKQLQIRQENIKSRQTVDYDRYLRAQPLNALCAGDPVWVQDAKIGGTVVSKASTPRLYLVHPDDVSTNESTTSGADADRAT